MKRFIYIVFLGGIALFVFSFFQKGKKINSYNETESEINNVILMDSKNTEVHQFDRKQREVAAVQKKVPATQTLENAIQNLQHASGQSWSLQALEDGAGFIHKMQGGLLRIDAANTLEASQIFLKKYAKSLFGIDSNSLALQKWNRSSAWQSVSYQQTIQGIPIYNSKIIFMFDSESNLVYASSQLETKYAKGYSIDAKITQQQAVKIAFAALEKELSSKGKKIEGFSVNELNQKADYFVYRTDNGLTNFYRFIASIPHEEGEYEIAVDANNSHLLFLHNISRK